MVKDMLTEIYDLLKSEPELADICVKSFKRPESLEETKASIVLKPISSPIQSAGGSNRSLAKRFIYQINVESPNRIECKRLQSIVEKAMIKKGFYQTTDALGNLEDYLSDIKRYIDVRTYRGSSPLYQNY